MSAKPGGQITTVPVLCVFLSDDDHKLFPKFSGKPPNKQTSKLNN